MAAFSCDRHRSSTSRTTMLHHWMLFLTILSTITVVSSLKWHIEAGPNLPTQDSPDNNNHHQGFDKDRDPRNIHNAKHHSMHMSQDIMQADRQIEDNVGEALISGIQSHSSNEIESRATTGRYLVDFGQTRSQLNSKEIQENMDKIQDSVELINRDISTEYPITEEENPNIRGGEEILAETVSQSVKTTRSLDSLSENPTKNVVISQEEPAELQNLVVTLQEQLLEAQTSQVRTRSILNVIQETQATQAKDLQTLKDSIAALRGEQRKDQQTIRELQKMAEDNTWGISDLKTSMDIIRSDFTAFKALQLAHNETMLELEDLAMNNELDHDKYSHSIKHMQHQISTIKNEMEQDRTSLNLLRHQFELATRPNNADLESVPNNIPAVASENRYDGGVFEGSGDKSGEASREFDQFASNIEEKHNIIGHRIKKLLAKERQMEEEMSSVRERFTLYENDLSKLYAMFFNLSAQVSAAEKRAMDNQQAQIQTELQQLQQGFLNFSQQVLSLQQGDKLANHNPRQQPYPGNQQQLSLSNQDALDLYQEEMQELQQALAETKTRGQNNLASLNQRMAILNTTIQGIVQMLSDHNKDALGEFDGVKVQAIDLDTRVQHNDDRLTHLELKVLNASLEACHKTNADLRQDNSLHSLDKSLSKTHRRQDEMQDRINKIERGLTNLFEMADTQDNYMSKIRNNVSKVIDQLPEITRMKKEMQNFIMQLPADCSAIYEQTPTVESGAFLIHPKSSPGTAWVMCEFEQGNTYTVIQKRNTGELSFDKTWEEYKYGFGDPTTEYWLGNENLYYLTNQKSYRLHISMWDLDDQYWYAEYSYFRIKNEEEKYALQLNGYSGNATDALKYSNFMSFSTMDKDTDSSSTHCAKFYTAGWWYKHCQYGNLNGRYTVGIVWFNNDFDKWVQMQRTEMKIIPDDRRHRHYNLDNSTEERDNAT